jgi:hypothetical protein
MPEEKEREVMLECPSSYVLSDERSQQLASGECKACLDKESLAILSEQGETLFLSYRDILDIVSGDYKIYFSLCSEEKLTLFELGYHYEDFLKMLHRFRNELLLKDFLMHEALKKPGVEAEFISLNEKSEETGRGTCEVRLYQTALVLIPEKSEFKRVLYSDIQEIRKEDYALSVATEFKEKFIFSKMGNQLDSFVKTLSAAVNELSLKAQSILKEIAPELDPSLIRRAARLMKEGWSARRSDLEAISPEIWKHLEAKLKSFDLKEEYDFLKSLGRKEKICIGVKRSLGGTEPEDYIWFFIPICSPNPAEPGNAVAMEATSEEDEGRATYFFKILGRKDYPNFKKIEDLDLEADNFLERLNRCLVNINFRREPVYLSEEKLEDPNFSKYKFSIQKIPGLRELREAFIGRVVHSSLEQWKNDVLELLKFNVSTSDDKAKWVKKEEKKGE